MSEESGNGSVVHDTSGTGGNGGCSTISMVAKNAQGEHRLVQILQIMLSVWKEP